MEKEISVTERMGFLTLKEVAEFMGFKLSKDGSCRQIERYSNREYCQHRGIKVLPHYFRGSRMKFNKQDFQEWLKQFKDQENGL